MIRLIKSLLVWWVYFPQMAVLRLLGPTASIALSRLLAWVHWLGTFAGVQARMKRAVRAARPMLETNASVAAIVRRNLEVKHQRFVEWYLYNSARGRRYVAETYRNAEGREHLDRAVTEGKGVVVVMFHYGVGKLLFPALENLGYPNYHHVFRGATYADETVGSVAKAAMKAFADSEEKSGLKVIYHRPGVTFTLMVRHLKRNEIVCMNGDGMMGTDFVDVPFLGGAMPFPAGPAQLAAAAGAPIVPVFGLHEGIRQHRLYIHEPIRCAGMKPEAVAATVRQYVGVLESYVRRYPWAWWTWRRMDVEQTADGSLKFVARALKSEGNALYHYAPTRPEQPKPEAVGAA